MNGKVLVAGATGAIGMPLVRQLVDAGWRVFGSTRDPQRAETLRRAGVEPVVVDVFDTPALNGALESVRPDVVVHQLTDLPTVRTPEALSAAIQRNARLRREGTRNLVQATLASGCRRMVAQSIAWAYGPGPLPHAETDPLDTSATGDRAVTVHAVLELESLVLNSPAHCHVIGNAVYLAYRAKAAPGDVLAVMNTDGNGQELCKSSRLPLTGTNPFYGLAYDGTFAGGSECGTSFSAPRVAWLLALRQAYNAPIGKAGWPDWYASFRTGVLSLQSPSQTTSRRYWLPVGKLFDGL